MRKAQNIYHPGHYRKFANLCPIPIPDNLIQEGKPDSVGLAIYHLCRLVSSINLSEI